MYHRVHVREGMIVRSSDGRRLGKVYAVSDTEFQLEKGLFFPKDYACRYTEILDIRHGQIILAHGQGSLRRIAEDVPYLPPPGSASPESSAAPSIPGRTGPPQGADTGAPGLEKPREPGHLSSRGADSQSRVEAQAPGAWNLSGKERGPGE